MTRNLSKRFGEIQMPFKDPQNPLNILDRWRKPLKKKKHMIKLEDLNLNIEDFEQYCESMYDGFEIIQKNIIAFMKYRDISDGIKMHLLQEMFDFFYLEEDYDRCGEINKWLSSIYVQKWVKSSIYKEEKNKF
jgi:hypothetical protein